MDLSQVILTAMDIEFNTLNKKLIKGFFFLFQDIQKIKTPFDSCHEND